MGFNEGELLGGRYKILELIGSGGHGRVYRALDQRLERDVAIKRLHPKIAVERDFRQRMAREARAMGQLAGTSAVQVLDFSKTESGQLYLVMEYLEGRHLGELISSYEQQRERFPLTELVDVLEPIVTTLSRAHKRGIIHRDLKPENIIVLKPGSDWRSKLLDFGLVKDLSLERMTKTGMVPGSPGYIAPEAWLGRPGKLDHRLDVYGFGVIVYRILARRLPFDVKQPLPQLIAAVTQGKRPRLRQYRRDLSPAIDQWVKRALAIKPQDRFQTIDVLWNELRIVFMQSKASA